MHRATAMPFRKVAYHDETETVQMRLYKSLKVWSMYADLEESFGTFKVYFVNNFIYKILNSCTFSFADMQSCVRQNYRSKNRNAANHY